MKFLCVECDEPMKLQQSLGPDGGSMTVVFSCPSCAKAIAMLTNPMETQMVRSLDVKIGGGAQQHQTMETLKESLATKREDIFTDEETQPGDQGNRTSSGKCPFTGVVEDAMEAAKTSDDLEWTPEAQERIGRIPPFVRPMAQKGIEEYAREKGYRQIDTSVMDEVKGRFGM